MNCKEFVEASICKLRDPMLEKVKQLLIGEYISFSIIAPSDVTRDILAEKICDYFETLETKTSRSFDKLIETYMNDLDAIVGPHIAKTPQPKKGDSTPVIVPRTRRYYEKAVGIKGTKNLSVGQLVDYSRIMMCLYAAAIQNGDKPIENFDFAADCLVSMHIIEAMKKEEISILFPPSKKKRFDMKERYSDDVSTLMISILILCVIIDGIVEGENGRE